MARIDDIVTVTIGGLLYKDIAEIPRWIDFKSCHRNWCLQAGYQPSSQSLVFDVRCVARFSLHQAQLPYIEFFTDPVIRLEFEDANTLRALLAQLQNFGQWTAHDLD